MNELLKSKIIVTAPEAPRLTIIGPPGIGKTTLCSQFPDNLFLLAEQPGIDGLTALPVVNSYKEFNDNLVMLAQEKDLPFKTIVIDSITKLDILIADSILREAGTNNMATAFGGYGAGYKKLAYEHREIKKKLNSFQKRGIAVICIAHLAQTKVDQPDKDDFFRYTMELIYDKSRSAYIDDSDGVFFCKQEPYLVVNDDKLKKDDPNRKLLNTGVSKPFIITDFDGVHHAKSRFKKHGMPARIDMNVESIMKYIPFYNLKGDVKQ